MKWIVALLCGLLLAAPAMPQNNSPYSTARPPERFQKDNAAVVVFVADVSTICGTLPDGYRIIACVRKSKSGAPIMVMPNPCLFPGEVFSHIACHELAHVSGWTGLHEE
jgi:hypothetical protein